MKILKITCKIGRFKFDFRKTFTPLWRTRPISLRDAASSKNLGGSGWYMAGKYAPLVRIGLTDLPKTGVGGGLCPPTPVSLPLLWESLTHTGIRNSGNYHLYALLSSSHSIRNWLNPFLNICFDLKKGRKFIHWTFQF